MEQAASSIDAKLHDIDRWSGEPLIVVFFIALEQSIAVPEATEFRIIRETEQVKWLEWSSGFNFVGLRIHRHTETIEYQDEKDRAAFDIAEHLIGDSSNAAPEGIEFGNVPKPQAVVNDTIVEAATVLILTADSDPRHAVSAAFDRCLDELHRLGLAYLKISSDVRFRPITRQTCRPIIPWTTELVDGSLGPLRMFWVHEGTAVLPFTPEEFTPEQVAALRVSLLRTSFGDPIASFAERARLASRALQIDGDYTTTIIHAYTACEVLMNTVLLMVAWEEDVPREECYAWFKEKRGFISRMKTHLQPRLGGNWGTQKPDNPMSHLETLAQLRHDVVHNGHFATEREAQQAIHSVASIEAFVKTRLGANQKKYPRTTLLVLGKPGLKRRGLWGNWMRHFEETTMIEEPNWLLAFSTWRDRQVQPLIDDDS